MKKERIFLLKRMPILNYSHNGFISVCFESKNEDLTRYQGEQINGSLVYNSFTRDKIGEITEKTISQELFIEKYKSTNKKLTKQRYFYTDLSNNNVWMVDKFTFLELVTVTVVCDENTDIQIPDEIKNVEIIEITENERFDDFYLSDNFETLN